MTTMKAVRFTAYKTFPELKEIERPTPGPGEVLLKVAGAGACHSDVAVYDEFEAGMNPLVDPEYTLGHETSGWVEELGEGVTGWMVGDRVLVEVADVVAGHVVAGQVVAGVELLPGRATPDRRLLLGLDLLDERLQERVSAHRLVDDLGDP